MEKNTNKIENVLGTPKTEQKELKIEDKMADLFNRVEQDLAIDEDNITEKSLQVPYLYGKWMREFTSRSVELKRKQIELEEKTGELVKYYKEEYNRELKATEIEKYLFTDKKYVNLYRTIKILDAICQYLEGATKKFSSLGFDIKNYIEIKKFINGVN